MEDFPVVHRDEVRLRDVDARSHVNNAVYSSYMEDAVLAWYAATGEPGEEALDHAVDMVLVRSEIDFRSPVRYGEEVEVGVRVAHAGTRSIHFDLEVRASGRLAAEGKRILAGYDHGLNVGAPIPEHWLTRIEAERRLRSA